MKKIVLGAVLVLLITIGGGVYFLLSNLDDLVKSAIETYGSEATQTTVQVESVKIGLQNGSGEIKGLTVGSPPGFIAQQVFYLGEIATQIELASLSEEMVVIEYIRVLRPEIFFELNAEGKTNLDVLKKQLASGSSESSASSSQESSEAPKILIRKLLFTGSKIHAKVIPLNKNYELKLPKIELKDLGGQSGASPAQITDQVLKILTDRALAEIKKQGIDQYKKQLEAEVNKRIDAEKKKIEKKIVDKVGQQVGDKLKGILNY